MVQHGFRNRPRTPRYAIESPDHAISADSSGGAGGKRRGLPTEGDAGDGGVGLLLVGGEAGAAHQVRRPGGDPDYADQQSGAAGGGGGQGGGYRSGVEGDLCGGEG